MVYFCWYLTWGSHIYCKSCKIVKLCFFSDKVLKTNPSNMILNNVTGLSRTYTAIWLHKMWRMWESKGHTVYNLTDWCHIVEWITSLESLCQYICTTSDWLPNYSKPVQWVLQISKYLKNAWYLLNRPCIN